MDFKKLITRYRQFGGMRLVWEYAKLGVVPIVMKGLWRFTVKGSWFKVGVFQCCKGLYGDVLRKVEPFLMEKYGTQIPQIAQKIKANTNSTNQTDRSIWWCWLQGIENAPSIVRACYNSLVQGEWFRVHGYTVSVIDDENWREYVELPGYIVAKWEKGRIPAAMFSDLLRVELLIKYGGTWIDSTVLCTGFKFQDSGFKWQDYLDAELFLFQYSRPGSKDISISNWFITARRNNEVLRVLREMLYAYWKDYDCVLDYYMFHLFFSMIAKEYPEEIAMMPYGYSPNSLVLLHHWGERFDQHKWDNLISKVYFHKLAFRESKTITNSKGNYYNWIIKTYLQNEDI